MNINYDKKGQGINADLIFTLIFIFVLGLVFWFLIPAFTDIYTGLASSPQFQNSTLAQTILTDNANSMPKIWDSFVLVLLIFLFIIMMILGFLLDLNPIVFGSIVILLFLGLLIVAASLSNSWELIVLQNPTRIDTFPIINFTMNNYPYIIAGLGFLLLAVVYGKSLLSDRR